MIKKILLGLTICISIFLLYVAQKPSQMLITRELLINAQPEAIFPYINHSKKSNEWMPWREEDPSVKMNYSGPEEGVGSIASWDSAGKMGTGQAEIVDSIMNRSVKTKLSYTKPMEMNQLAEVSLAPTPNGTLVRWSVTGENSFISRIFCVFINMDKMIGGQFEKGLHNLKQKVETKL